LQKAAPESLRFSSPHSSRPDHDLFSGARAHAMIEPTEIRIEGPSWIGFAEVPMFAILPR